MFGRHFDAELSIKKWAGLIRGIGFIFMGLCFLAAIIVLGADAEYLWWVSLIILGGGGLTLLGTTFTAVLIWGFGDVVGNTKRMATGTATQTVTMNEELPEL